MQFHGHANQSHFHKNGFALRLALKQRQKGTRKWTIGKGMGKGEQGTGNGGIFKIRNLLL